VAAYYDRLAPVYGEGEYFRLRRAVVLGAIGAELAAARAVLDLGCGNGAYAGELAARAAGARVVGADLSPEMIRQARRRLGARISLLRADATALPFCHGSFDLVFMSHVLLLVSDIERCVAEVSRCLALGGCLVATVGHGNWRDMVGDFLGADAWPQLEALFGSGLRAAVDDETRAAAACARAGLQSEARRAAFSVAWSAVEEWIRIRWLSIVDDAVRELAERLLAQVRPRAAELHVQFSETLLVARKPR
jgi:SAM-dependent methyltransferase